MIAMTAILPIGWAASYSVIRAFNLRFSYWPEKYQG